jgi:hypothetical protein
MKDACAKIHERDSRGGKLILRAAWVTYRRRQIETLADQMKRWSETLNDFYTALPADTKARLESPESGGTLESNAEYMRQLSSYFGSLALNAKREEVNRLKRESKDITILAKLGPLRSATFEGQKLLVEYKPYRKGETEEQLVYISNQIGRLANFLEKADPTTTGILACEGWIEAPDMNRFGILFKVPVGYKLVARDKEGADGQQGLTTLHSVISEGSPAVSDPTKRSYTPRHALDERLTAAGTIAIALYSLHSYNWVHEGLRSSNIVMLAEDDEYAGDPPRPPRLGRPFLLGFDGARSNTGMISIGGVEPIDTDESRFAENLYRHPDRQGETSEDRLRYQMCHDQYSLGVVLLEIGLWMPLEKEPSLRMIRQQTFETPRAKHFAVRQALIRLAEARLGITFGHRYQAIVLKCLQIKSSASYDLSRFLYDVVEPLSSMKSCLSST